MTWLYDYTFGDNAGLMNACSEAGVEYMPMVVRTPVAPLCLEPAQPEGSKKGAPAQ